MVLLMSKLSLSSLIFAALILTVSLYSSTAAHAISTDSIGVIQPRIKDVFDRYISQAKTGSPVMLEVGIENNEDIVQPFVLLVEVRESSDITIFLAWQSGSLGPMEQSEVGVSWTPKNKGEYEIRAFAITDLQNAEVLSELGSRVIEVGDSVEFMPPISDDGEQESPPEQDSTLIALRQHALDRINEDRAEFGLEPVELSDNKAAQVHADEVLKTRFISHWMTNGEKPYMTYTRFGGLGAVSQNVGISGYADDYEGCISGHYYCEKIDPYKDIDTHQYTMMYEDKVCCDNGHRDNILDSHHTHVSIGIAYDDYFFVVVQNFEENYIDFERSLISDDRNVVLKGTIPPDTAFLTIYIGYDETPTSSVYENNKDKGFYDAGEIIAGVTDGDSYYSDIETITADSWMVTGNEIDIAFDLGPILDKPGVYTIWAYLEEEDGRMFPVTSYSVVS
jgi:hypothetical protein